jgi:hypothetical protein
VAAKKNYPKLSSAGQLAAAAQNHKLETADVEIDRLELTITVRELTGFELDLHKRGNFKKKGSSLQITLENTNLRLAAMAVIDEHGNNIFRTVDEGVGVLGEMGAGVSERLVRVINTLNGQDDDEKDAEEGNSEGPPGDSSFSD